MSARSLEFKNLVETTMCSGSIPSESGYIKAMFYTTCTGHKVKLASKQNQEIESESYMFLKDQSRTCWW
jgi:hypothetical protein